MFKIPNVSRCSLNLASCSGCPADWMMIIHEKNTKEMNIGIYTGLEI
jgi:hypothetical protein